MTGSCPVRSRLIGSPRERARACPGRSPAARTWAGCSRGRRGRGWRGSWPRRRPRAARRRAATRPCGRGCARASASSSRGGRRGRAAGRRAPPPAVGNGRAEPRPGRAALHVVGERHVVGAGEPRVALADRPRRGRRRSGRSAAPASVRAAGCAASTSAVPPTWSASGWVSSTIGGSAEPLEQRRAGRAAGAAGEARCRPPAPPRRPRSRPGGSAAARRAARSANTRSATSCTVAA